MLEVSTLTKRFGGLYAVKDVTTTFERGRITAVIGPNGAGKTTFFNLVAGAYRPSAGTIRLDGRDVTGMRPDLVAGGQYGNHGAAMDGELRDAGSGGERDRRCAEAATRLEEGGPLLQVAATRADRAAGFDRFVDEARRR